MREDHDDYVTHHDDWVTACRIARDAATEDADRTYWQHQLDTLDRLEKDRQFGLQPTHTHVKTGGSYRVLCTATIQASTRPIREGDVVVVYQGIAKLRTWGRLESEFNDGRFIPVTGTASWTMPEGWTDARTGRGFTRYTFKDSHDRTVSLQDSSVIGDGMLWFGGEEGPVHLSRDDVRALLPVLHHFATSGNLPEL